MEVFLQYWDELDDAWYSLRFVLSRPWPRLITIVLGGSLLASCGAI